MIHNTRQRYRLRIRSTRHSDADYDSHHKTLMQTLIHSIRHSDADYDLSTRHSDADYDLSTRHSDADYDSQHKTQRCRL
ncbi:hypothetical protein RRG08_065819 [Elysia crispata]|uniref:Uncharacterized protein n=1 Tax=Elysia crispata TaxID=231223 RepID=A0AAE1CST1_9GAST|nr:hypothetical protein RRG08_065819 [Elysia crispata]